VKSEQRETREEKKERKVKFGGKRNVVVVVLAFCRRHRHPIAVAPQSLLSAAPAAPAVPMHHSGAPVLALRRLQRKNE
jgi:hypothetical protein